MSSAATLAQTIRSEAQKLGFDHCQFASVAPPAGVNEYDRFLAEGRHGDMEWLVSSRDARADPGALLSNARSVVVLGMSYAHPRPQDPGGLTGKVASYAWGRDYHNRISKRLRKFCTTLRAMDVGAYWGVDARPLIERAWAERAGLGFLGKNCLAIVPSAGSWFFLAVILVDAELPPTPAVGDHCGPCVRCLDVCPTGAFTAPGELDARLCISYLTIEHRGLISPELRPLLGRWVFGCDDCQEVCPHNPAEPPAAAEDFAPRAGHAWLDLEWVMHADAATIDAHFEGSPLRRAGPIGLKRNAAIVLGNLGDPAARPSLKQGLAHPDPVVQAHSRWALDRL